MDGSSRNQDDVVKMPRGCTAAWLLSLRLDHAGFSQYPLSTVAAMLPCPVLRCANLGAAFVAACQGQSGCYREAYVCAEHRALIDGGAPWYMEGHCVLMGQDIPPVLESWSARPGLGAEGFTLTMHVAGRAEASDVFLTPTTARALALFIIAANSDGVCRGLTLH